MLDAQKVLCETGRDARWTARGASDRNMMEKTGGAKTKRNRGSHGGDDRRQWMGSERTVVELFLRGAPAGKIAGFLRLKPVSQPRASSRLQQSQALFRMANNEDYYSKYKLDLHSRTCRVNMC